MQKIRHKKRQTDYTVLLQGRLQTEKPLEDMTILKAYVGSDGNVWYRTPEELSDGRFEELPGKAPIHYTLQAAGFINDDLQFQMDPNAHKKPGAILVYENDAKNIVDILSSVVEAQINEIAELKKKLENLQNAN